VFNPNLYGFVVFLNLLLAFLDGLNQFFFFNFF
jgi:hypothetical protein